MFQSSGGGGGGLDVGLSVGWDGMGGCDTCDMLSVVLEQGWLIKGVDRGEWGEGGNSQVPEAQGLCYAATPAIFLDSVARLDLHCRRVS